MSQVNITFTKDTPESFEPETGQFFQVNECHTNELILITDDTHVCVILSSGQLMDVENLDEKLTRDNLVIDLKIEATIK